MNLEEKLRQLQHAAAKSVNDRELERQLEYLRRRERVERALPAKRVPRGVEAYIEGEVATNERGDYFHARQALPFGRPYGKLRIGDVALADFSPLDLFLKESRLPGPSELVYLDTETTGLMGGTGTCAFLIGLGAAEGSQFVVRQFFLRDYPEEKAMLAALTEALTPYKGIITFNGRTFDLPLLETRYALARMKSPFERLIHLDLLHPARRLWKLRLESCQLTHLEQQVLGVRRQGDVTGAELPGIYFDYLRTGNASGLQPVFYHNSLDIITLAALSVELARVVSNGWSDGWTGDDESEENGGAVDSSLDLFSLSRIFERAGVRGQAVSTCRRALKMGLPEPVEVRALLHLSYQHKRQREYEPAAAIWTELAGREREVALTALEELAIYHEHRRRDPHAALEFVEMALRQVDKSSSPYPRFAHRRDQGVPAGWEPGIRGHLEESLENLGAGGAVVERHLDVQAQTIGAAQRRERRYGDEAARLQVEVRTRPDVAGQEVGDVTREIRREPRPRFANLASALLTQHPPQHL